MAVSYNKLWKLLVDKKMSKSDLRKKAEIAPNTMTKLRRDEEVSLTKVIDVVCKIIDEVSFAGRTECEKRGCAAEVFCKISKKNHKGKTGCHRCSAGEDQ